MIKPYKLSLILPSNRPETWMKLYAQMFAACKNYSFEMIAVGPKFPTLDLERYFNFKFFRSFSCPSRCIQMMALLAEGEYLAWIPDDAILMEDGLAKAIELIETKEYKDGVQLIYSEGPNFSGTQHLDPLYWMAATHDGLKTKHLNSDWRWATAFLYRTEFYCDMGGIDCRFEYSNFNTHDLSYRVQRHGGKIYPSPIRVMALDWRPLPQIQSLKGPIQLADEQNDRVLFQSMYNADELGDVKISYNNWKETDVIWKRKYAKYL